MSFWPTLHPSVQHAFQSLYGLLMLVLLVTQLGPPWRRFFLSERWGGYAKSTPFVDALHRPIAVALVIPLWLGCSLALILNWQPVAAALVNLLLCRYYFVAMRWRGVFRGFGAPGFMSYWFGLAALLLSFTRVHAPTLQPLALLYLQIDIALIILSAGFYKFRSGYRQGEGMDYGMINPMWGYWPAFFRRLPTGHWLFGFLNQSAWLSQLVCAALMVLPPTRWIGGLLEVATYLFIATQIRLGWLSEQMVLVGLLFFTADSPPGVWWATHWPLPADFSAAGASLSPGFILGLGAMLWLHLGLTVCCHAGLFLNFYGHRRLPGPLQKMLETYANFFGIIIWRVFSVDHLNFHIEIYRESTGTNGDPGRVLISEWRNFFNPRFWHVGEAITVTSLFTTLKYFPSDNALFRERLLRYSRTLPCPTDSELVYDYISIRKMDGRYTDRLVARYRVNPREATVAAEILEPAFSPEAAHPTSPVHEGSHPGSYAPRA